MIIEDYQTELTPQKTERKNFGKTKVFFAFFAAWLVLVVITSALFLKPIAHTLKETDAIYILRNVQRLRKTMNTKTVDLCFVNLSELKPEFITVKTEVQKGGSSEYHDVLEGLLAGPSKDSLKDGYITLIARGTKLEGFARSSELCFICLSKEFLQTEDMKSARTQIEKTIRAIAPELKEIIILVEGKEI